MRTGIITDLPIADYHADAAFSKSGLKLLLDNPPSHYEARYRKVNPKKTMTDDTRFGQAFHDYVLERHAFDDRWGVWNFPKTGRHAGQWKAFKAEAEAAGREPLSGAEYEKILAMNEKLEAHATARLWLPALNPAAIQAEASFFWTDPATGLRCKCRADMLRHGTRLQAADLKTCRSVNPATFRHEALKFGYHMQDAAYTSGISTLTPDAEVEDFLFICIEKLPPFSIKIYRMTPAYKRKGWDDYRKSMDIAAACEKAGVWPDYPPEIEDLEPPYSVARDYQYEEVEEDDAAPEEYALAG